MLQPNQKSASTKAEDIRLGWMGEPYKLPVLRLTLEGTPVAFSADDQKQDLVNQGILIYFTTEPGARNPTPPVSIKVDGRDRTIAGAIRSRRLVTMFLDALDRAEQATDQEEQLLERGPIRLGS